MLVMSFGGVYRLKKWQKNGGIKINGKELNVGVVGRSMSGL
jgi:hypothetical protein